MTYCIISRRGTSKLLELVPNPFDDINKICSKQKTKRKFNMVFKESSSLHEFEMYYGCVFQKRV